MLYDRLNPKLIVCTAGMAILLLCTVHLAAAVQTPLLTKVRSGDDVTVVLLGTSLTDNGAWPSYLQTWLNSESGGGTITVINRGASGQGSDHGLAVQTPAALADNPDAVFIEFGVNDAATSLGISLAESESNLSAMIDAFEAQDPMTNILLQTMNNVADNTSPFSPRVNLAGYYQIYRDIAAAGALTLIDHYPNWLDLHTNNLPLWESYMNDPVHPNALGQQTVVMPELQAVLTAEASPIPTPTALGAGVVGLVGLLVARCRR